jgi:hypothetical protein
MGVVRWGDDVRFTAVKKAFTGDVGGWFMARVQVVVVVVV